MDSIQHGKVLRIYVGEEADYRGLPLYRELIKVLKENGLRGATVYRGIMGYGRKKVIYTKSIVDLSEDLPIMIEAVDCQEKIDFVLPLVTKMMGKGLVATSDVEVIS